MTTDSYHSESNEMPTVFLLRKPISTARILQAWWHWAMTLLPLVLVLAVGFLGFRQEIINSVLATPHPELVYAIAVAFSAGALLACITLYRYTIEANLADAWKHTPAKQRNALLQSVSWSSYLTPLYEILAGNRPLTAGSQQAVLEHEIDSINTRLIDRLTLPQYLAGALVGLGLVGTFIGLLGTLEDLGKLFGTLVNSGSDVVSPTEMFSDMVRRLQDPMRGMGTAFVASLYGLLGSLVLGLQILIVGKIGQSLSIQMHALIRSADAIAASPATVPSTAGSTEVALAGNADAQAALQYYWEVFVQEMKAQQSRNLEEVQLLRREILGLIDSNRSVTLAIHENIKADGHYHQTLIEISANLARIDQRLATHLNKA